MIDGSHAHIAGVKVCAESIRRRARIVDHQHANWRLVVKVTVLYPAGAFERFRLSRSGA
jgi:hypothetical protein